MERVTSRQRRATTYVLGAPDVLTEAGALTLPPGLARKLEEETAAGPPRRRLRRGRGGAAGRPRAAPPPRLAPVALVVLEETLRPDAAETIAVMRERGSRPEADLRRRPGRPSPRSPTRSACRATPA